MSAASSTNRPQRLVLHGVSRSERPGLSPAQTSPAARTTAPWARSEPAHFPVPSRSTYMVPLLLTVTA
jgi:hypothetical protein